MLNDLILNYWQIKRRFEKEIVIHIFRLVIYIWYHKKRKKMISQEKKDLASWKLNSNICRLSGILECNFWGYKVREMLLDFVYGICFPLASSILLKCSKLYSSTRVLGKYSNSWIPRKRNIAENYFFHVYFIIWKLLLYLTIPCLIIMIFMMFLNVFHFLLWHIINDSMNKHWIFWKIFFKIYRKKFLLFKE